MKTNITLSLADKLIVKILRGIVEDVLEQVENFYYSVDFFYARHRAIH